MTLCSLVPARAIVAVLARISHRCRLQHRDLRGTVEADGQHRPADAAGDEDGGAARRAPIRRPLHRGTRSGPWQHLTKRLAGRFCRTARWPRAQRPPIAPMGLARPPAEIEAGDPFQTCAVCNATSVMRFFVCSSRLSGIGVRIQETEADLSNPQPRSSSRARLPG